MQRISKLLRSYFPFHRLLMLLAMVAGLQACVAIPKSRLHDPKILHIGNGTEDLVIDDFGPNPRLIISCDDRRHGQKPQFSSICSYDLETGKIDTFEIKEYPLGLTFRPHGMDLQQVGERLHLFVVCHDDSAGHHWIADFQVDGNQLFWVQNYHAGLLTSPNAVCAFSDGSLFVTNDHLVRNATSESIWKKKVATIVHFNPDLTHSIAYSGLCYGNGITQKNGYVYAAATVENAVYRFKIDPNGSLSEKTKIAKVKGPDNLRWDGDDLIVACHLRLLKFLAHAKDPKKISPTTVYRIKLDSLEPIPLYSDSGRVMSGGSTGIVWKDRLFVGQVFEDWILELRK